MADLWRKEGDQFFDDSGNVLSGGVLRYFDAGTSNGRTVYKDDGEVTSWGTSVTLNSAGRLTDAIYIPTGDFKETLEDSGATQIFENDDIPGAVDLSVYLQTSVLDTPVLSKTSNYTILSGDAGKLFLCDPTGGAFTMTLPNAGTVGDGYRIHILHNGTANQVLIAPVASQTIDGEDGQVLTHGGQVIALVSDGGNWQIDTVWGPQVRQTLDVVDRDLLDPPASPTAGAWYLLPDSGTLLNAWSGFSNADLVQADGQGGWIQFTPTSEHDGLCLWIEDEEATLRWTGGSWSNAIKVGSYTVATVPAAAQNTRSIIYVSDETGGATLAFSDGANWRRVTDRAVVS